MPLGKGAVAEVDAFLAKARARILHALERDGKRLREVSIVARIERQRLSPSSHIEGPREYFDDEDGPVRESKP